MPRRKRVEETKEDGYTPDKDAEDRLTEVIEVEPVVADEPEEEKPKLDEEPVIAEAPKKPKSSGMVKVKVLAGTLGWSEGYYEKGEIFEISKKDLKRFDPRYYEIIE